MATKKATKKAATPPTGTTVPPAGPAGSAAQKAADAIANLPSGSQAAIPQSNPVGVPYYATGPNGELTPDRWMATRRDAATPGGIEDAAGVRTVTTPVLPRYYEGDTQAVITSLPPEVLADLQAKMVAIGLYGSKKPNITFGIPDNDTFSAFDHVLQVANASGATYNEVLQNWSATAAKIPQPVTPKPSHAIQVTNTEDLVNVFKDAARTAIGREVSVDEARKWATTFQASQAAEQNAAYAAQDAPDGSGNTLVQSAMSPASFAEQQLRGTPEYGATRASNQLDVFRKILSGPFGGGQ